MGQVCRGCGGKGWIWNGYARVWCGRCGSHAANYRRRTAGRTVREGHVTQRKTVDWRGVRIPAYAPRVEPRIDYATGERVCVTCEASLEGRTSSARFCSHNCRSIWHKRVRRKRRPTPEVRLPQRWSEGDVLVRI